MRRTLLFSVLAIVISAGLVVGGTYAIFSDKVTVNNHLKAGTLDVGLNRVSYQEYTLSDRGTMTVGALNTERVDLTKDASSVFSVSRAVPTSWYEAKIEVSNNGSVAFDYGVRVIWDSGSAEKADKAFADQIKIKITSTGLSAPVEFMLSECEGKDIYLGSLLKGSGASTFIIRAEFVNDSLHNAGLTDKNDHISNNAAMLAELDFDLQVYATQRTAG